MKNGHAKAVVEEEEEEIETVSSDSDSDLYHGVGGEIVLTAEGNGRSAGLTIIGQQSLAPL